MFDKDILEQIAEELINVQDIFAMPDPGYELHLRLLAGKLLDYRDNLIEAENMLFWDDEIEITVRDNIIEKMSIPLKI